ncbi:MAG: hypothetical protein M1821_008274 [Bathelium mastoideum]|nr:MAG: hypothetical protein M1821_008274 [Bathelium mastoideum]
MVAHSASTSAGHDSSANMHAIHTKLLIPGRGQPSRDMTVIIKDSQIHSISPTSSFRAQSSSVSIPSTSVPVLLPGLWDCHVHYFGKIHYSAEDIALTPPALAGVRIATDAARTLNAGFTSVREVGGYGPQLATAIQEGQVVGPNIYSSVAMMSPTAGHGDSRVLREAWLQEAIDSGVPMRVVDGVAECRKAVRQCIRRGAKVIKVAGTGGVLSAGDDPEQAAWSVEELEAMVEEAGRAGRLVAAHCHGKSGILQCLEAGVKTIEHGTYLDEEVCEMMKEKDAILVATRTIVENGVNHPELMNPGSYQKILETAKHHAKAYALAVQKGVTIALGTDLGLSLTNSDLSHGNDGKELKYAVEAGMTPLEAIEAATARGPSTLGSKMAPKSGQIREGYDADLIALSESPLDNIEVISNTENVTHVWKGGRIFKAPGMRVGPEL